MESKLELLRLSQELLCHILGFLPVTDMLSMGMTCKKLKLSVKIYLQLCKKLDLCDTQVWGLMPLSITDDQLFRLLQKCPKLEILHGLRPQRIESRRLRGKAALSVPGVIDALLLCPHLQKVETNSFDIFEAVLHYLPHVEIDRCFRNYLGGYPPDGTKHLKLTQCPLVKSLHLTGIFMHEIGYVPTLEHLQLQWIRFTHSDPFSSFRTPKLKTFVMKHCFGPDLDFGYMPLFSALSHAPHLKRLECIRLPIPGGLIQRVVEESWHVKGFQKLEKLSLIDIKNMLTTDIGYLMVAAARNLRTLSLSPELLSDNFFASLHFARCDFTKLKTLTIAHVENLWNNHNNTILGQTPNTGRALKSSSISDRGMKTICSLFPCLDELSISHSPYLNSFENWNKRYNPWKFLRHLTICHCYCLDATTFLNFIKSLEQIEVIILKDMFPKKPRGCSHVGLSAGTGLGLKSVSVQNRDERVAVFDEPFINGRDPDPQFFNLHNVNNGVECQQHGVNNQNPNNGDVKVKLENDCPCGFANNDPMYYSEGDDEEEIDPLNVPSTSSGITRKGKRKSLRKTPYEGPLTRHRSQMISKNLLNPPKRYHQSTQTCFSSLHQNGDHSRQTYCCTSCRVSCHCHRENNTYDCNDYPICKQGAPRVPPYLDASTSTNDPIHNDEGSSESISISSATLKSLTIISCGIHSIQMCYCPALEHAEAQACGNLRHIIFDRGAASIIRFSISQCPRYNTSNCWYYLPFVDNSAPHVVYFEPSVESDQLLKYEVEQIHSSLCGYTYAVIYDFGLLTSDRACYRENLLDWLRFTQNLMKALNLYKKIDSPRDSDFCVFRIYGVFADNSRYELVTNNLLLATVWNRRKDSIEICPTLEYSKISKFSELVSSLWEIAAELDTVRFYSNIYRGCFFKVVEPND